MVSLEVAAHPAAVFIDRDGVINELIRDGYVMRWKEFSFRPGALAALRLLAEVAIPVVVVTNQSCVGRGLLTSADLTAIHDRLRAAVVESGGALAGIEVCPHHPDDGCACRKPEPGLLLRAAQSLAVDVAHVVAVGDSVADLAAAAVACCRTFYWVEAPPDAEASASALPPIEVVPVASLWEAACRISGEAVVNAGG